jgi:hypothetical protein
VRYKFGKLLPATVNCENILILVAIQWFLKLAAMVLTIIYRGEKACDTVPEARLNPSAIFVKMYAESR